MRKITHGFFATLAGFCMLCLLAGMAGGVSVACDFLNNFMPIWLGIGFFSSLFAMAAAHRGIRRWSLGGVLIFTALTFWLLGPEIWARVSTQPDDAVGLRIVQFNAFKDNRVPDAAAAWVIAQRPDIVLLEEALNNGKRVRELLSEAFPYQVSCVSDMRCSTVILSRHRPLASGGLARGDPENRGGTSAAWARFAGPRGNFLVVAAHFQRPWPFGDQVAARLEIAEFLAGQTPAARDLAILGGDFNLTPWSAAMRYQDQLFAMPRLSRARPSWPVGMAVLPIDHIYAGREWRLGRMTTGPALGSDHYPLLVTLLPAKP